MKNLFSAAILLIFSTVAATAQTNYEAEIAAFEAQDKATPPPAGGIVFVGSSSIRLWNGLAEAFPGKTIIQRGFGGSEISDVIRYMARVVSPYAPKQIVLYAGDNDIGQSKLSAREVYARFTTFYALARKQHPTATITYIAIKPSPARRQFMATQNEANQLIKKYLAAQRYASYIDVYTPMLNASGQPRPELFVADSLHMNAQGYDLWKQVVGPALK
jgi:lysophospholipase L1-like esterase